MRQGRTERPARSRGRACGAWAADLLSSASRFHVEPQCPARDSTALHALHAGKITMLVIASVILDPHVVALIVDEARLPIPFIHFRMVDRNDVFELVADLADAFD